MTYQINTKEELECFISHNWIDVNKYICEKSQGLDIPFYSSVDIRESKTKYAPVDHNLYPAGFNNLCQLDLDASEKQLIKTVEKHKPGAKKIAIIPESNTKNTFYLDHLSFLSKIFMDAGYELSLISFDKELFDGKESINLISHSKFELTIFAGSMDDNEIHLNGNKFDLVILNNDQSNPLNIEWTTLKTPVTPSPLLGWYKRQKSIHFQCYKEVADEFCSHFSINPDLIQAKFIASEGVDFSTKDGFEKLATDADKLLAELSPGSKVFVKASQGTYGMGISVVGSGEEIISMNRKNRNKMDIGKNKIKFTSLIIQEGVDSMIKYDDMAAEITIYLIGGIQVGGFVRANSEKDSQQNLNSKGMVFRKYCISEIKQDQDYQCKEAVYSVISRLSTLASSKELERLN